MAFVTNLSDKPGAHSVSRRATIRSARQQASEEQAQPRRQGPLHSLQSASLSVVRDSENGPVLALTNGTQPRSVFRDAHPNGRPVQCRHRNQHSHAGKDRATSLKSRETRTQGQSGWIRNTATQAPSPRSIVHDATVPRQSPPGARAPSTRSHSPSPPPLRPFQGPPPSSCDCRACPQVQPDIFS